MAISLKIGERGKPQEFIDSYTKDFLEFYGFEDYKLNVPFSKLNAPFSEELITDLITVQTKYGELVVQKEDVITYVGNGIWSVSKDE